MAGTGGMSRIVSIGDSSHAFASLAEALDYPYVTDGEPIVLRAGTHMLTANKTISKALTITNYPGEDVFLKIGNVTPVTLTLAHAGARIVANAAGGMFRIGSEPLTRVTPARFAYPVGIGMIAVSVGNPSGSIAGCYLHDLLSVASQSAGGGELYRDCVCWNFGYDFGTGTDGEFAYLQNAVGAPVKTLTRVIFGQTYAIATQIYRESGPIGRLALDQVTSFSTLWGSSPGVIEGVALDGCVVWAGTPTILGFNANGNGALSMHDSILVSTVDRAAFGDWQTLDVQNNVIVSDGAALLYVRDGVGRWDDNDYYNPRNRSLQFGGVSQTFAQWQAAGRDVNGTHTQALPAANVVRVHACDSGSMVAQIAVLNWERRASVNVDISGLGLTNGASYRLRNALDPLADYDEFTYDGSGALSIPMAFRSVAIPIGASAALAAWDNRFGAFVLEAM